MDKERRTAARIPVQMWVEESSDRALYFQRGANLSVGGLFLERTIPHAVGTVVNLQFTLPGDTQQISVKGEIVNVSHDASELGMGLRFVDIKPEDKERIERFIEKAVQEGQGIA